MEVLLTDAGRPRGLAHEEDENTLGSAGTHEVLDQSLYLKHRQQPSALSLGARAHGDAQLMSIPKNPFDLCVALNVGLLHDSGNRHYSIGLPTVALR